ncbi:DsbA family protein [Alphaproteobacteria bacterium KMM 3653]|uniref:DsbA family protein n=1 Tax=Harenicola maris TaxID=2841044 RepID=A0AAP2G417_9RHOB|nr:DsbA family protein [Harenicola maris]
MNTWMKQACLATVVATLPWAVMAQTTTEEAPAETAEVAEDAVEAEAPQVLDMTMGQEDAPVTVIEYGSFTCPHCASFHVNTFSQIKENYIETGKVKFIHREVYFDRYGLWAGMMARCAGPERYFALTDLIYTQQGDWVSGGDAAGIAANLRKMGLTSGMDPETLDACMSDGAKAQALVNTFEENRVADDVTSTPTFIINGEKFTNMSFEDFAEVLDDKLGE